MAASKGNNKKSKINIKPSKKGTFGAITGKNKDGSVKASNAEKIVNVKKDPKAGEYPTVKIDNGGSVKVTPAIKKKAVFYENFAKK